MSGIGNIILLFDKDCIYVKCPHRNCKSHWKIKITIPGVNVDLNNAAFVQTELNKFPKFEIDENSHTYDKTMNRTIYGIRRVPVIIAKEEK